RRSPAAGGTRAGRDLHLADAARTGLEDHAPELDLARALQTLALLPALDGRGGPGVPLAVDLHLVVRVEVEPAEVVLELPDVAAGEPVTQRPVHRGAALQQVHGVAVDLVERMVGLDHRPRL